MKEDTGDLLAYYGYPTYYVECSECGLRTQYDRREDVKVVWNKRKMK